MSLMSVYYDTCDHCDRGFHGKARRVPVQPMKLLDCDTDGTECTINGELHYAEVFLFLAVCVCNSCCTWMKG